ncbi:MAG: Protein-disulfide reductase [uncultured bacterium]|nr:MAG: Protein-disulfide reductase [uncultured bacterium]
MKKNILFILVLLLIGKYLYSEEKFEVNASLDTTNSAKVYLVIKFIIPQNHYIYSDQLDVSINESDNYKLVKENFPEPILKHDKFQDKEIKVYNSNFEIKYLVEGYDAKKTLNLNVKYQGCSEEICFLPKNLSFKLGSITSNQENIKTVKKSEQNKITDLARFRIIGKIVGYANANSFIKQMTKIESSDSSTDLSDIILSGNIWITLFSIIIGGLALNLTPCVLPMIPVNLAIIGAGLQAGNQKKGFLLGSLYALGIALSYGTLGLVVVLTGKTFGALNSSPLFNLIISIIFLILALAMYGIINIDFSKFHPNVDTKKIKGNYFIIFVLGGVSALLAGACVAPVVIAVLIYSSNLYAEQKIIGLFLPFVLGIGMALPWPFAGAGLSFLPKPGKWMELIKKIFAVLILVLAIYYGNIAYQLYQVTPINSASQLTTEPINIAHEGWFVSIEEGLQEALKNDKPVIIDFWASWCKNCVAMDNTTFKDPEVVNKLNEYVKIKFISEKPENPETKKMLDYFGVMGLPTIVILEKK